MKASSEGAVIDFLGRATDDWHGIRMDRTDFGIGLGCEKSEQVMFARDRIGFPAACAIPRRPDTREECQWLRLIEREPSWRFPKREKAGEEREVPCRIGAWRARATIAA